MTVCVLLCMSLFSFLRSYALKALIGLCINFSHILISNFEAPKTWSCFLWKNAHVSLILLWPVIMSPLGWPACIVSSLGHWPIRGQHCVQVTNQRPRQEDWHLAMPGVKTTQTASLTAWAWAWPHWPLSSVTSLRSELSQQQWKYFYHINLPQNMSKWHNLGVIFKLV